MAIIIKQCLDDGMLPDYNCNPCGVSEKGRVRGACYIEKSLKNELIKENLESVSWWKQQIEAGLIKIIPTTRGTSDGGTPVAVTGYGNEAEKMTGKDFVVVVNDRNHKGNAEFYAALEVNRNRFIFGFRTGSQLRIATDKITNLSVQDPVEEDVNSDVTWNATVTWRQNVPQTTIPIYTLTDEIEELFENCIEVEQ